MKAPELPLRTRAVVRRCETIAPQAGRRSGGWWRSSSACRWRCLIGFIGLALDGGHLYLTKTELQNGADACALAASYELTGSPAIVAAAFDRADAAGKAVRAS